MQNMKRPTVKFSWDQLDIARHMLDHVLKWNQLGIEGPNKKCDPLDIEKNLNDGINSIFDTLDSDHFNPLEFKRRKEIFSKIENDSNFKDQISRVEPTHPDILQFIQVLGAVLNCDLETSCVIIAEFVRTGVANKNTPYTHSVSVLILGHPIRTGQEARLNYKGLTPNLHASQINRNEEKGDRNKDCWVLRVTKAQFRYCLNKCDFKKEKNYPLRSFYNNLTQEIILAGLIIQKINTNLDLSGDLAKEVEQRRYFYASNANRRDLKPILKIYKSDSDRYKFPLKSYEKPFLASYSEKARFNLNALIISGVHPLGERINLDRADDFLAEDKLFKHGYSLKKKLGRSISFRTRCKAHFDGLRNRLFFLFSRDRIRRECQKPAVPRVERAAWDYLSMCLQAEYLFLPSPLKAENKKGPSDFLIFIDEFKIFIDSTPIYCDLSRLLSSDSLHLLPLNVSKILMAKHLNSLNSMPPRKLLNWPLFDFAFEAFTFKEYLIKGQKKLNKKTKRKN